MAFEHAQDATTVPGRSGKAPDLHPGRIGASEPLPLELPRLKDGIAVEAAGLDD